MYKETLRIEPRQRGKSMRNWNNYFMQMAEQASTMATCDRLHVGCVLVKDKRVIATGFNGSISGHDHCDDVGHLYNDEGRCIRTVHAEQNAIIDCARRGVATDGAVAYCTHEPCEHCTRTLVQAGVKRVYFKHAYKNKWNQHFNEGIEWIHLTDDYIEVPEKVVHVPMIKNEFGQMELAPWVDPVKYKGLPK